MPGDDPLGGARRVLVYGVTGSGKTTLAERIGHVTSLPWYSVDELTWEPGWVEVPIDQQRRHFRSFTRKRDRIQAWMSDDGGPRVVRLVSPRATEAWLTGFESATST